MMVEWYWKKLPSATPALGLNADLPEGAAIFLRDMLLRRFLVLKYHFLFERLM
jgi:hypothetical protein